MMEKIKLLSDLLFSLFKKKSHIMFIVWIYLTSVSNNLLCLLNLKKHLLQTFPYVHTFIAKLLNPLFQVSLSLNPL